MYRNEYTLRGLRGLGELAIGLVLALPQGALFASGKLSEHSVGLRAISGLCFFFGVVLVGSAIYSYISNLTYWIEVSDGKIIWGKTKRTRTQLGSVNLGDAVHIRYIFPYCEAPAVLIIKHANGQQDHIPGTFVGNQREAERLLHHLEEGFPQIAVSSE